MESRFVVGTEGDDTDAWHCLLQETTTLFVTEEFITGVCSMCLKPLVVFCQGVISCFFLNSNFMVQRCS